MSISSNKRGRFALGVLTLLIFAGLTGCFGTKRVDESYFLGTWTNSQDGGTIKVSEDGTFAVVGMPNEVFGAQFYHGQTHSAQGRWKLIDHSAIRLTYSNFEKTSEYQPEDMEPLDLIASGDGGAYVVVSDYDLYYFNFQKESQ